MGIDRCGLLRWYHSTSTPRCRDLGLTAHVEERLLLPLYPHFWPLYPHSSSHNLLVVLALNHRGGSTHFSKTFQGTTHQDLDSKGEKCPKLALNWIWRRWKQQKFLLNLIFLRSPSPPHWLCQDDKGWPGEKRFGINAGKQRAGSS